MVEDRIAALETRAATLEDRVCELELARARAGTPQVEPPPWAPYLSAAPARPVSSPPPGMVPPPPATFPPAFSPAAAYPPAQSSSPPTAYAPRPSSQAPAARPAPAAARPPRDLEDFLGGSVLAWLGGVAVLAGLAFLLTIAISRGWLGEGARTALAGALSLGLLAAGAWLRERRAPTEAALAAAAVGIAGCFGTLVVAGPVYELMPQPVALFGAFVTGAAATALATRWRAPVMGWLGLLGALWAPAALGALDGGGIAFLAIAYAATVAVLVWQRWTALAGAAFAFATIQWVAWLLLEEPAAATATLTLAAFGALTAALALGLEARRHGREPVAAVAAALLVLDAAVLAGVGWVVLEDPAWLAALAAAHLGLGLATTRVGRVSRELALLVLAVGVALADVALTTFTSGLPLVLVWSASSIAFAALLGARPRPRLGTGPDAGFAALLGARPRPRSDTAPDAIAPRHPSLVPACDAVLGRPADGGVDWLFAAVGLVAQLSLAIVHTLAIEGPATALAGPAAPVAALVAVAAIATVAWAAARLADIGWRVALDAVALVALAYLTGLALEGVVLTAALAAEAVALTLIARDDDVAAWGSLAFAGAALAHALAVLAPPLALIDGLDAPFAAAVGLAAAAVALAAASRVSELREPLRAAAALTLLYLASVEVVTAGGPEHTGQALLSVLWAVAGVGALIRGLLVDDRPLRRGALALLAVTAAKVFLYDLASLESLYRVGSLIGFGLLLLCGAFAYQRVRPRQ